MILIPYQLNNPIKDKQRGRRRIMNPRNIIEGMGVNCKIRKGV